ncbi:putative thiol methyltransferase 2 isoform X1 [Canna indica]|uniref:Thiol methyltransferase 2 isoform X1 n=1 Tax=Canna indica TaxID=4628 RepID=A0AAQ3Q9M9_9LILI|nr:putative thiol methyltransferase 2 isoform X1 [Canna indica]
MRMLPLWRIGLCQRKHELVRAFLAPAKPRATLLRSVPAIYRLKVKAAAAVARMASAGGDEGRTRDPASNPKVVELRKCINKDAKDGWEKCWEEGLTPWDLGQTTPAVSGLVQSGSLPKGRVLIPGCGHGYDVVAMAGPDRYVVGLDISTSATEKAKALSSSLPNANQFTFVAGNFFTWQPTEKFDLIFDYTFFCAIDPCLRPAWAEKIKDLLKPEGELITLIMLVSDQEGGPPFNTTVADYEEVLTPVGFKAMVIEDNELAVKPRKGREKLARWKRISKQSSL